VEITRIDLRAKQVIDTGNKIPGLMLAMSPDRFLIYTRGPSQSQPSAIPIYTFNPATGEAQQGGTIEIPASPGFFTIVPAIRD
jgi:hypothetical protein